MATVCLSELPRKDLTGKSPTERLREVLREEAQPFVGFDKIEDVLSISCEAANNGLIHGSEVVVAINQMDHVLKVDIMNSEEPGSQDLDCVRYDDRPGDVGLNRCHGRGFDIMRALLKSLGGTIRTKKTGKTRITTITIPTDETKTKPKPTG